MTVIRVITTPRRTNIYIQILKMNAHTEGQMRLKLLGKHGIIIIIIIIIDKNIRNYDLCSRETRVSSINVRVILQYIITNLHTLNCNHEDALKANNSS